MCLHIQLTASKDGKIDIELSPDNGTLFISSQEDRHSRQLFIRAYHVDGDMDTESYLEEQCRNESHDATKEHLSQFVEEDLSAYVFGVSTSRFNTDQIIVRSPEALGEILANLFSAQQLIVERFDPSKINTLEP